MNLREWALPVYTILIQLATGGLVALWWIRVRFARLGGKELDRMTRIPILILFSTVIIGIIGAHFHLSKPFFSFTAMANFVHSWLSREILVTVLFSLALGALMLLTWFVPGHFRLKTALGWIAAFLGLATVFCMAQVYLLPTQIAWNSAMTVLSYYVEAALLGTIALGAILLMDLNFNYDQQSKGLKLHDQVVSESVRALAFASAVALVANLALNSQQIIHINSLQSETAQMSMRLLSDLYQPLFIIRLILGIAGVSWLMVSYLRNSTAKGEIKRLISSAYIACTMVLVGEILGRFLFYAVHVRSGI